VHEIGQSIRISIDPRLAPHPKEAFMPALELILPLGLGVALAASAGLRAFVPLFAVSVLGWGGVIDMPDSLAWLSAPPATLTLAVAVLVEILADKIPGVDHVTDLVGTVVRPLAGALVGTTLIVGADPLLATVAGLATGGSIAGLTHATKATVRVGSTGSTGGIANPAVSIVEDVIVLATGALAAMAAPGVISL
jgi:hypothetical protein